MTSDEEEDEDEVAPGEPIPAEGEFSTSMTLSPAEGAEATVSIEGSGMTSEDLTINQEMVGDSDARILVEGTFTLDSEGGSAATDSDEDGAATGGSMTSEDEDDSATGSSPTSPTTPSDNSTEEDTAGSGSTTLGTTVTSDSNTTTGSNTTLGSEDEDGAATGGSMTSEDEEDASSSSSSALSDAAEAGSAATTSTDEGEDDATLGGSAATSTGTEDEEEDDATAGGNATSTTDDEFSSSVMLSPAEGAEATVTVEGSGMMVKSMGVSQETANDGSIHIIVQAHVDMDPEPIPVDSNSELIMPGLSSPSATTVVPEEDEDEAALPEEDEEDEDEAEEAGSDAEGTSTTGASIELRSDSGPPGDQVNVDGSGFEPNDTVTVTMDGDAMDTFPPTVIAGSDGEFIAVATVPDDAADGDAEIAASDASGNTATESFAVSASGAEVEEESETTESEDLTGLQEEEAQEAAITLDPDSGAAGTDVDIEGEGFVANESIIVSFDGTNLATGTVNAGSDGEFTATVTIPDDAPEGDHDVSASDSAGTEATETFTVEPESGAETSSGDLTTETPEEETTPEGNLTSP